MYRYLTLLLTACGPTELEIIYDPDEVAAAPAIAAQQRTPEVVKTCASLQSFRDNVVPVMQARCVTCHGQGGPGNAKFNQRVGSEEEITLTYSAALTKLLASDGGDLDSNPIIARPTGHFGHSTILTVFDDEYDRLKQWVRDERRSPCQ